MRVLEAELRRIHLPLAEPFRTSSFTMVERDILLVRVVTEDAIGWGECVAFPAPVYSAEWVNGAQEVLSRFLLPVVMAASFEIGDLAAMTAAVKGQPMAKAALEMAVLDADLRAHRQSLADWLGGVRREVEVGVSVGIAASIGDLVDTVERYVAAGYRRVKLKIEPGRDLEPVAAVRSHVGPTVALQVDANTAYTADDIDHLVALDAYDLVMIEQPFDERDLDTHARLAQRMQTPVCLDESIESERDAVMAIEVGACSIVNVKAGRVGGYLEARRIHDRCAERGVAVWCGGMLETGLGRAANLALASLPGFTLPGDISASDRYYRQDITPPFVLDDGCIAVPDAPGIGVRPDPETLEQCTTSVIRFPAP